MIVLDGKKWVEEMMSNAVDSLPHGMARTPNAIRQAKDDAYERMAAILFDMQTAQIAQTKAENQALKERLHKLETRGNAE